MAAMNHTLDDAVNIAGNIQQLWLNGQISRFDIVDRFLDDILQSYDDHHDNENSNTSSALFLHSNLKVLVTSKGRGLEIIQATNRQELKDILKKTTWIPFVTGDGVMRSSSSDEEVIETTSLIHPSTTLNYTQTNIQNFDLEEQQQLLKETLTNNNNIVHEDDDFYLDGGFSRMLHPICEHNLHVPNTLINLLYTLHPGMQRHQINSMFEAGQQYDHPLLELVPPTTTTTQPTTTRLPLMFQSSS